MEPYQKATETLRYGEEYPIHILKNAGLTAIGGGVATAGSKVLSKLIPAIGSLINQYVPENISIAGLNKINPNLGKFVNGALDQGYSFDDVRTFLGEKIEKSQTQKSNKNIIQQESPELHEYLLNEIKKGRKPIQAAALAQNDKRFTQVIDKLMKSHKTPWSNIIESVFGSGEQVLPQQNQQQESQQAGPGQAALMDILQKIQRSRGGQ